MSRFLCFVAGVILLVDGYVYGRWTGRWHQNTELAGATERLERIPMTFGDWRGEALVLESKVIERAEFSGYVLRRYENRRTGAALTLLVACGRSGPLTVHTPEICYRGAGFRLAGGEGAAHESLDRGPNRSAVEFFKGTFAPEDRDGRERLRVIWSWCKNGAWVAPDNPRWKLAGLPVLHKVYVTQLFVPRTDGKEDDPCLDFFREVLPEVEKVIGTD
jgi:hypothetical protein